MKKTFLGLMMILLSFAIYGCANADNPVDPGNNDTVDPGNNDTTDPNADDYAFSNVTQQTAQELSNKILYYKDKLVSMSGLANQEMNSGNRTLSIDLGPNDVEYKRDELPPEYDYAATSNEVDPEFLMMVTEILNDYAVAIITAETFEEDVYFTIAFHEEEMKIKIRNEGDQLYIESYIYGSMIHNFSPYYHVSVNIMYMNMIDGHVYFEYVRDYYEKYNEIERHDRYYDFFYETGDMLNISVNMLNNQDVYYQNFEKENDKVFLFASSAEGMGFNYTDAATDTFYSTSFNSSMQAYGSFVSYGTHDPMFRYSNQNGQVRLQWNLFDVTGWDTIVTRPYDPDQIFMGDTEVLTGFSHDIQIAEYSSISTSLTLNEQDLTENVVNLSDYGLSFTGVTLSQVLEDASYLETHYPEILTSYGFSTDMTENHTSLLELFPFGADEQIVSDLKTQMVNELNS